MDFDSIFGDTSTISKQFEARWFFDLPLGSDDASNTDQAKSQPYKVRVHRMPFQRRTLSYWVGIQYGRRWNQTNQQHRRKQKNTCRYRQSENDLLPMVHSSKPESNKASLQTCPTTDLSGTSQKLDLLYDLWKHRVRNYNDAFLSTSRRNTRMYTKTTTTTTTTTKTARSTTIQHDGEDSSPSSKGRHTHDDNSENGANPTQRLMRLKALDRQKINGSKKNSSTVDANSIQQVETEETSIKSVNVPNDGYQLSDKPKIHDSAPQQTVAVPVVAETGNSSANHDCHHQSNIVLDSELDEMDSLVDWRHEARPGHTEPLRSEMVDSNARVLFHFLFVHNQQACFLTDATPENYAGHRRCIFCYFDGASDVGLLMHCVTCHGQFLSFKAARDEEGTLHIAATKRAVHSASSRTDAHRDFLYVRAETIHAGCVPSVPFVQRCPAKLATMDLQTRRKKMRILMEVGADEAKRMHFAPSSEIPVRQYFHSRSNEPMLPGEWDVDSDDEEDERWLTNMGEQLMDEFEDVTSDEKRFCKQWNRFMKSHTVIADGDIPSKCFDFVHKHASFLTEHDLRQELLLHFMGFWDSGLISSTHLMSLMEEFDKIKSDVVADDNDIDASLPSTGLHTET